LLANYVTAVEDRPIENAKYKVSTTQYAVPKNNLYGVTQDVL